MIHCYFVKLYFCVFSLIFTNTELVSELVDRLVNFDCCWHQLKEITDCIASSLCSAIHMPPTLKLAESVPYQFMLYRNHRHTVRIIRANADRNDTSASYKYPYKLYFVIKVIQDHAVIIPPQLYEHQ
jgi:hypothetical protein